MDSVLKNKLIELDFKEDVKRNSFTKYSTHIEDRFNHILVVYPDGEMYINRYKMSGLTTITFDEIIRNHNNLNSGIKKEILKLIKELLPLGVKIYNGEGFKELEKE